MGTSTKKCLVIGNNEDLKEKFNNFFQDDSFKISFISEVNDLYTLLKDIFNVAIVDSDNIDVDIYELIENIKIISPLLPIVVLSSSKEFKFVKKLIEHDVSNLVRQPILKKEFLNSVQDAIHENIDRSTQVKLLKLAQQRSYDILLLKEIAESTTQKRLNLNVLLDKIINMIANLLDVKVVSIMLLYEKTNTLKVNAYKGHSRKPIKGAVIKLGEGVSGYVAKTGKPLLINDIEKNEKFSQSKWANSYNNNSLLTIPIKTNEKVIGVINVNNKVDNSQFNENDKNILVTISHQVAMAIENFRLYDNINKKAVQLEKSIKKLSDLSAAKSKLLCNLSHELKTPLTSVVGYIELLLTFTKDDSEEDRKNFLEIIHTESLEIAQLIEKILNFFDLETDRVEWDIAPLDLNDVINDVIEQFESQMKKDNIKFKYMNKLKKIDVSADSKMIKTAIEQLFDNAIKFNDDRHKLTLKVEKCRENGSSVAKVTIFNTGAEIKGNDVENIFKDFYQPGNIMTDKPKGLGLGLATTRNILKKHKGAVYLDASNKRGNTFVCKIPLVKESVDDKKRSAKKIT
jgi:K+-sensing histidine kinase KdpD